jgi:hypothetical protein
MARSPYLFKRLSKTWETVMLAVLDDMGVKEAMETGGDPLSLTRWEYLSHGNDQNNTAHRITYSGH